MSLTSLMILVVLAAAQAQYPLSYYGHNYFRIGYPQSSFDYGFNQQRPLGKIGALVAHQAVDTTEPRFFTTLTATVTTTTKVTTITSYTTCTTSTSTLKVCTPSGRRRRGVSLDKESRGLYYNDQEDDGEDGSIFLPSPRKVEVVSPVVSKTVENVRPVRELQPIPYMVQPGFQAPAETGAGRFLLAFGTATVTSSFTTTYTSSLTATCQSTTGYQTCGSTGK